MQQIHKLFNELHSALSEAGFGSYATVLDAMHHEFAIDEQENRRESDTHTNATQEVQ